MKEAIKCCISCILPCGALDVIRIVHANGRVEEISRTIRACEVMQAYPKHVLRRPPPSSEEEEEEGAAPAPKSGILPPTAELQRGKIYFLIPVSSAPEKTRRRRKKRDTEAGSGGGVGGGAATDRTKLLVSDQYLSEILSEKVSSLRDRRRGRVGIWRPHLESISEISNDI